MASTSPRSILLVDDEGLLAGVLKRQLERSGAEVVWAQDLDSARRTLALRSFDLVLLDLELPDGHGFDLLRELREEHQDAVPVVILTGAATLPGAVEAMRLGATDYLAKPDNMQETLLAVEKAMLRAQDQRRGFYSRQLQHRAAEQLQWIGDSVAAQTLRSGVQRIASVLHKDAEFLPAVLLVGETGSGKNMVARLLHGASPRHEDPFLQVDCGSLPASLIEAELFGHKKGAFSHAHEARVGLMEAAEDGILFLDEIGEIPLELQAKLLAALDRRTVRRVGSNREIPIRAAIIAATHRDLGEMVATGAFRQDLFYRLHGLTLPIPPLRERVEDIPALAQAAVEEASRRFQRPCPQLSTDSMQALQSYPWPGNVRELKNILGRAVLLSDSLFLEPQDLGLSLHVGSVAEEVSVSPPPSPYAGKTLEEVERGAVEAALASADGNVSEAARILGISRGALRNRLDRFGLGA